MSNDFLDVEHLNYLKSGRLYKSTTHFFLTFCKIGVSISPFGHRVHTTIRKRLITRDKPIVPIDEITILSKSPRIAKVLFVKMGFKPHSHIKNNALSSVVTQTYEHQPKHFNFIHFLYFLSFSLIPFYTIGGSLSTINLDVEHLNYLKKSGRL
jgi:hypothetical protein